MNKAVALERLAEGILLIIFGVSAVGSFSSDMARFFTGLHTGKAISMRIGGVILATWNCVPSLGRSCPLTWHDVEKHPL